MIFYLISVISGTFFSFFLIKFRFLFYEALKNTVALSNAVLSTEDDLQKQKLLINALKNILFSLALSLGAIAIVLFAAAIPTLIYVWLSNNSFEDLQFGSVGFLVSFSAGSILPFLFNKKSKDQDYSEASQLFHFLILDNYNLGKLLFSWDKRFKKEKNIQINNKFLIVSGLARSGTTSLTEQLHKHGHFHSLDYSNMPFLMAPNFWKRMYSPNKNELKERKHGDKVMFGLNTVEALEEYFFKVQLNDCFIANNGLLKHTIDEKIHNEYLKYQQLIKSDNDGLYLAKNNNLLLRYESLRALNSEFETVFMFRNPLEHAYSLLNQHKRFCEFQEENEFTLTYMNWLGHHEFGKNQKTFVFEEIEWESKFDDNDINFWLEVWINYYSYLLTIKRNGFMLIDYDDYLKKPQEVLIYISSKIEMNMDVSAIEVFQNPKKASLKECNTEVLQKATEIFESLLTQKVKF